MSFKGQEWRQLFAMKDRRVETPLASVNHYSLCFVILAAAFVAALGTVWFRV
jgi:hypothetical protein